MKKLIVQDWYKLLIQQCKVTIGEAVFISRWALVEGYHQLGKRILKDRKKFENGGVYGKKIVTRLTKSLNQGLTDKQVKISERTVQRSVQFAKKYPDLSEVPEGKNISWNKICNQYLPEPRDKGEQEEEFKHECPKCHFKWS